MEFLEYVNNKDSLMLLDVIYHKPTQYNDKIDCIDIIYKDLITNKKYLKSIKKPKIELYFVKDEFRNYNYNKTHMELEKCEKHVCEYKSLPWYIANVAGENYVNALRECLNRGQYSDIQRIHTYPYVFGSDIPIDTFYRIMWQLNYDNELLKPLTKTYLDIEVDIIDFTGVPLHGECPINAVSIVDDEGKTVYTLLLNNPKNPLIKEFIDDIDNFIDELHEMFDESYGKLNYKIYMYDDEKDLVKNIFKLINTLKRDYCLIYNGFGFDIPYIIERIKVLGMDPAEIMCHPDFEYKDYMMNVDHKNFAIKNKSSSFKVSGYTKFVDQMILYAATRKGQKELRSNALNSIAKMELGDEKLDYTDEANIKTLPYKNYRKFVAYNIKDTLLQMGIERKVNDIENLYIRSMANCTSPDTVFKETVMLKSRAYLEYLLQGYILGNNVNVFNPDPDSGYSGAVVGNPLLNSHTGYKIFGKHSMFIFNNVIDMDFSSMYPHIIIAFNIERCTMIGKLIIDDVTEDSYPHIFIDNQTVDIIDDSDDDNDTNSLDMKYDSGKDFMENYLTGDTLSIGTKWFNLPDAATVQKHFQKKFNIKPRRWFNISNIKNMVVGKAINIINTIIKKGK